MVWASWLNFLLGIWLIIAGFSVDRGVGSVRGDDMVIGIIVAVCALISALSRATWASWINLILGIWLIIAAFALPHARVSAGNDLVFGIVIAVLAAVHLFAGRREPRMA